MAVHNAVVQMTYKIKTIVASRFGACELEATVAKEAPAQLPSFNIVRLAEGDRMRGFSLTLLEHMFESQRLTSASPRR